MAWADSEWHNRPLRQSGVKTVGRAALVAIGAGWGIARSLQALRGTRPSIVGFEGLEARLTRIEKILDSIPPQPAPAAPVTRLATRLVTREELAEAIDRTCVRMQTELDIRFEAQNLAAGALRAMIGQTDELLERVLEGIESASREEELRSYAGQG